MATDWPKGAEIIINGTAWGSGARTLLFIALEQNQRRMCGYELSEGVESGKGPPFEFSSWPCHQ